MMFATPLALCAGNPPVTGGFPPQRASSAELWWYFCCSPNKPLNTQLNGQWNPLTLIWHHPNGNFSLRRKRSIICFSVLQMTQGDNTVAVAITFIKVQRVHYQQYKLIAVNSVGSSERPFTVTEGGSGTFNSLAPERCGSKFKKCNFTFHSNVTHWYLKY